MFSFDDDKDIDKATEEELADWYLEARDTQGLAEATKQIIWEKLNKYIPDSGKKIGKNLVTKRERITFPGMTISEARELNATKTPEPKEEIDQDILKVLYKKGVKIPKVKVTSYPIFTDISEEKDVAEKHKSV